MTTFLPESLGMVAWYESQTPTQLVASYARLMPEIVTFSMTGMTKEKRGSLRDILRAIDNEPETEVVHFSDAGGTDISIVERDGVWSVRVERHRSQEVSKPWLRRMVELAREATKLPGYRSVAVSRHQSTMSSFVPEPPIAAANHAVVTTEAEVAAAYDDPALFWKMWKVEPLGDRKLCTRALDDIEEDKWLARTFESTMALVRGAKPKRTVYNKPYWEPEFAAWWEFGDLDDEKAGNPALAPIGYDEADRCYDLTGFITKTPLARGGPEPRHVLIREIYEVRRLARGKKDPKGRPIEAVRITFPEGWMARQEKRPLLDAGARVFYGKGDGTELTA